MLMAWEVMNSKGTGEWKYLMYFYFCQNIIGIFSMLIATIEFPMGNLL